MLRVWASAVRRVKPVRAYSTFLSSSAIVLQRGDQGRGGISNGGPQPRQQYPPQLGDGDGNRSQNYGNREQKNGNHQESYDNRPRGYNGYNRVRGYIDSRRHNSADRPRSYGNRDGDTGSRPRGGHGGRPPRRRASDFLQENAERLLQMKQAYKQSKSSKERMLITREARHLIRRSHADASTQDERSVIVFLNCAATFQARSCDGLEEASRWVQANAGGLSPQNVALFANALGVINLEKREEVFCTTVIPLLPSLVRDMTPVEVVMVLQAFQRLRIREYEETKDALLLQLEPCIPTMPVPQLSTLAEVLTKHHMRETNGEKWRQLVEAVMKRALESVETMHSKEAITFLEAAPKLQLPQEQLCSLLARATATAGFHRDEQVGELFTVIYNVQKDYTALTPELESAVAALRKALIGRLEKVAHLVNFESGTRLMYFAALSKTELPSAILQTINEQLRKSLIYRNLRIPALARLASALAATQQPSPELLDMLAKYAIGERPPRTHDAAGMDELRDADDDDVEGEEEVENMRAAVQESLYARYFFRYTTLRLDLEDAYAKAGASPPEALTTTLPEHLVQHIAETPPRALLSAAWAVLTRPEGCCCRNTVNDEAIYQGVLADIPRTPEKYKNHLSPAFVAKMQEVMAGNPRGEELVKTLQRVVG